MIRPATHNDVNELVELGRTFLGQTILARMAPYDPVSVEGMLMSCIDTTTSAVFALESGGKVVGGIFGSLVPLYWNVEILAAQQFGWFVHPDHRGKESILLLRAWEGWAVQHGATILFSGAKKNNRFNAMDRVLNREGYEVLETVHVKGV